MKTKKFDKKLVLNKKTIAHLVNGEMRKVQGGTATATCCVLVPTCFTCVACATLAATACTIRPCCNTLQAPCGP